MGEGQEGRGIREAGGVEGMADKGIGGVVSM